MNPHDSEALRAAAVRLTAGADSLAAQLEACGVVAYGYTVRDTLLRESTTALRRSIRNLRGQPDRPVTPALRRALREFAAARDAALMRDRVPNINQE